MEKSDYLETKKDLDFLLEEMKQDALKNGVNILSKEYKDIRDKVKGKLLEKSGYNPSEFYAMERTYGDGTGLIEETKEKKYQVAGLAKRIMDFVKYKKNGQKNIQEGTKPR